MLFRTALLTSAIALTAAACGQATPAPTATTTATPPASTAAPASLFLAPSGSDDGDCTAEAPCASLQRAFVLAQPGQIVELAAGTYPGQSLDAVAKNATTHVVFRPAAGATVSFSGRLTLDGAQHVTLEGFQLARPGVGDRSLFVDACTSDVTFADLTGETFVVLEGTSDITFDGGSWGGYATPDMQDSAIGTSMATGPGRTCGGQPAAPAHDIVFDGVTFHDVFWNVPEADWGGSHPDCLELNGYIDGVTIRNSRFERCASTFLMIGPDQGNIANVTVENDVFSELGPDSWYGIQITSGGKAWRCAAISFEDNTYLPQNPDANTWPNGPIRTDCAPVAGSAGVTVSDNVFTRAPPGNECTRYLAPPYAATWSGNLFVSGHCGTSVQTVPLGYAADANGLHRAPAAAAGVVTAFSDAAAGTPLVQLAAQLSRTRAGGRRWQAAQLRAVLTDPVYDGGVGASGSYPRLVKRSVWQKAQRVVT